jgi:hypothetical protein
MSRLLIPSGDGDDYLCYFFKWPIGLVISKDIIKPEGLEQIELLGDGDFLRVPPTIGVWWFDEHGKQNRIVNAPDWLLSKIGLIKMMDDTAMAALG